MAHPAVPLPVPEAPPDHEAQILAFPCMFEDTPTTVPICRCGNATERGHNGFTCDQVLAIRARVNRGRAS